MRGGNQSQVARREKVLAHIDSKLGDGAIHRGRFRRGGGACFGKGREDGVRMEEPLGKGKESKRPGWRGIFRPKPRYKKR